MACGAFEALGQMTFMGEIDKIRQTLQSHPLHRCLPLPMIDQCLDACCRDIQVLVTTHAQLEAWNPGRPRDMRGPVAVPAVQGEFAGVEGMIECNWLLVVGGGVSAAFRVQDPNGQRADSGQRDQTKTLPQ